MNVSTELLVALQSRQDRVRNLCILAHVDHGKTTLSDHLIGSNGLIHPRMQGELRYLDSREDEQARGITMKASAISLLYVPGAATRPEGPKSLPDAAKLSDGYLVNLIDSPGHVDFCSEVSTAARLSDGALVVVDAVEGVCIQTHAVLRQAYEEKVKPVLVINKLDRLILELRLSPEEAYGRLRDIVTHANMVLSAFASERYLREADAVLATDQARADQQAAAAAAQEGDEDGAGGANGGGAAAAPAEEEEEGDAFDPVVGSVAFGSAADGWAFRLDQFAEMYAEKLGCKPEALVRGLWGDWAFSPKDKRVVRSARKGGGGGGKLKPMFVQFALEPIWKAYSVCDPGEDVGGVLGAIVRSRGLGGLVPHKALEHPDPRQALRSVLRAWLPLSEAVLGMAAAQLPSPPAAAPVRAPRLLGGPPGSPPPPGLPDHAAQELARLEACVARSDASPSAPLVVYVSKMVAVPRGLLPRLPGETAATHGSQDHDEVFLGFGRVFSGVARPGSRVHVLSGAYNPAAPTCQRQSAVLGPVYMMMGRALERVEQVPAGSVLAIAGLDTAVLKSATLTSTPACRPLAPLMFQAAAIVMVAVEPAHPSDLPALMRGLQLLNRADPFVEISVLDSGEHVLGAAGEVHLGTCIKDLRERFARVELRVSPPLVAFRESVFCPSELPEGTPLGGLAGGLKPPRVVEATTPNGCCAVRVRAAPLPGGVAGALDGRPELLRRVLVDGEGRAGTGTGTAGEAGTATSASAAAASSSSPSSSSSLVSELEALRSELRAAARAAGPQQEARVLALLERAWLLGPKRIGPNLLLAPPRRQNEAAAAAASGSSAAAATATTSGGSTATESLFDVPANSVVRAAKATAKASAPGAPGAAAAAAAAAVAGTTADAPPSEADGGDAAAAAPPSARIDLRLGSPVAALALGLISEEDARSYGGDGDVGTAAAAALAAAEAAAASGCDVGAAEALRHVVASVESGVVAGFQIATASGPLCEEPLWGVAFELEVRLQQPQQPQQQPGGVSGAGSTQDAEAAQANGGSGSGQQQQPATPNGGESSASGSGSASAAPWSGRLDLQEDVYGPFSGQVMTAVALACRRAVMEADSRLVEAQYLCQLTASAEALSGMYAVLGRRRARILREEMREGSDTFLVSCYLPAEASFGLADEMRRRSSGAASASLMLSHWERLQVDPFFVPTTEEEREEHGEDASGLTNLARRLIDAVRRRKGLAVEEKVVARATKQRTLKRNV
ncbi:hypothetical protein PLESTB_000984700 [Pleodorina starrii]|uniref:Ribosome assembly protein 1 n=1 Tax=Pleodorina starrii TaxID=330485 RepID=A0A9W6BNS6_9CHLO|nr:hypothetical protein PLESTB_000984700 [Pleodorina starrii]GLC73808.1 hypothetical protein PLESTF_001423300 [Pleodorina starrii]